MKLIPFTPESTPPQGSFFCGLLLIALLLAGCSTSPSEPEWSEIGASPWAAASTASREPGGWQHREFPGKRASLYRSARQDGRDAIVVDAFSSASMLRKVVRVEPSELSRLKFSWKVPALIETADMTNRDLADSPVRIMLSFDGDRSKFSAKDAMLSELAHAVTGEPMPYATLMYVWCNHSAPGTVLHNQRTGRVRKLVLESGAINLNRWLEYERDIRADFEQAFGEPPGALLSIGIMTDTDNTRTRATAWYGPVRHLSAKTAP